MGTFGVISAIWAAAVMTLLIFMVLLSYRIERRSNPDKFKRWPLRYANPIGTAFNAGVARDAETQALRKKLLVFIAAIAALGIAFAIFVLTLPLE